jgi:hypothetical protein
VRGWPGSWLERNGATSMPKRTRVIIGGVDTHGRTHHAAVIDHGRRLLGDQEFSADSGGSRLLLSWLSHQPLGALQGMTAGVS